MKRQALARRGRVLLTGVINIYGSHVFFREGMHVNWLFVTRALFGHYHIYEVWQYVRISDRICVARSELVK